MSAESAAPGPNISAAPSALIIRATLYPGLNGRAYSLAALRASSRIHAQLSMTLWIPMVPWITNFGILPVLLLLIFRA
jgi:hypothetical protein